MKYNLKFPISIIVTLFSIIRVANAQADWNTGGNNITTTEYLGTDGSSTSPVEIKTIETGASALPINFYTNNTQRATVDTSGLVMRNIVSKQNSKYLFAFVCFITHQTVWYLCKHIHQ